jgi:hypothetical protein
MAGLSANYRSKSVDINRLVPCCGVSRNWCYRVLLWDVCWHEVFHLQKRLWRKCFPWVSFSSEDKFCPSKLHLTLFWEKFKKLIFPWRLVELENSDSLLKYSEAGENQLMRSGRKSTCAIRWLGSDTSAVLYLLYTKTHHKIRTFKALLTTFKTEFMISLHALRLLSSF